MFFNSIKEINWLRKELYRLLLSKGMFFVQLTKKNRLRKEIDGLLSKGILNIHLKVTIEKN